MANQRQEGKQPGIISAIQSFFGLAEVIIGLVGALSSGSPNLRFACCLALFVLWLLVISFDVWGWNFRGDAFLPAVFGVFGIAVFLISSLNTYRGAGMPLPGWLLWLSLVCLIGWCFVEIFDNLKKTSTGVPAPRFLDSEFSIAVALALLISTPLWFSML